MYFGRGKQRKKREELWVKTETTKEETEVRGSQFVPVCSPPAVWGRCPLGCRWLHQSHRCPHTWPQTCAGTSWSGDPHYQSPVKSHSKIITSDSLIYSTINCDSAPCNYILWCHPVASSGYNIIIIITSSRWTVPLYYLNIKFNCGWFIFWFNNSSFFNKICPNPWLQVLNLDWNWILSRTC